MMSKKIAAPIRPKDALDYHEFPRPGKLEIEPTKPLTSQRDLALAYSPGVAEPCKAIMEDPLNVFRYTNRGNLVGVVTNGTATLGLGNTGPLAAKPVMEGKAVLLKTLAGVDAYDIELDATDPDIFIQCVRAMAPTFGAINLEDIAAPNCFYIEEELRKVCDIPIFHDDQHGTAIITGAALLNAAELQEKRLDELRVVFSGAGAAGIACARLYEALGVKHEHITMTDIHGVVYQGREAGMNPYLAYFAQDTAARTLTEALVGADVFVGLSVGGIVSQAMVKSMAPKPIIFALANPEPEIRYELVKEVCPDAIVASGRSDYPNQVNNVLCFPFIFRGALDVGARTINQEMEIAACHALAQLAHEEVPEVVKLAYGNAPIRFGPEYIIPKPFDPRALLRVAPIIAQTASKTGVARMPILDADSYHNRLERLQGASKGFVRQLIQKVQSAPPRRIVFPEGDDERILQAAQILLDEKIAIPVLMGDEDTIRAVAAELDLDLTGAEIFDHMRDPQREEMVRAYHRMRQRKGVTLVEARSIMRHREPYGMMLAHTRRADGIVSGVTKAYRETLSPALEIIGVREPVGRACGVFLVLSKHGGVKFFADTTVNIDPDEHGLAEIAVAAANLALSFDIKPRVAMLSYSNFGTSRHPMATRVARATALVKKLRPDLEVDGEMQVDVAVDNDLRESSFDFSTLSDAANVFVFPDLNSGNIGYKLLHRMSNAEIIGPVLTGMRRPVNVLQLACSVSSIVHLTVITCLQAQRI
jgi:malate dehydrogenase (oxaloacetate-decarboxylating)(NADP+)